MNIAAHSMFGTEKCHKVHSGSLVKYVNSRFQVVVNTGGIGDKSHALAVELRKSAVAQCLNTRLCYRCRDEGCQSHCYG